MADLALLLSLFDKRGKTTPNPSLNTGGERRPPFNPFLNPQNPPSAIKKAERNGGRWRGKLYFSPPPWLWRTCPPSLWRIKKETKRGSRSAGLLCWVESLTFLPQGIIFSRGEAFSNEHTSPLRYA